MGMSMPTAKFFFKDSIPSDLPHYIPLSLHLSISPSLRLFLISLLIVVLPDAGFAQKKNQRPQLQPAARRELAGKVILLPADSRYLELKTLTQIADHYLVLPPSRLLTPKSEPAERIEWLKTQDLTGVTGILVSLDASAAEIGPVLKQIRAQNSKPQIYGFVTLDSAVESSKQSCQAAMEMISGNSLDFLLIGQDEDLTAKPAQIARARMMGEAALREINDKVGFASGQNSLAEVLLAKLLAQRFGRTPKILPVFSSDEGSVSKDSSAAPLNQTIAAKTKLVGGTLLVQNPEAARQVDILLFVHTPQTTEEERAGLTINLMRTVDSGARIAFLDLSETKQAKEAMLAELRKNKLLGKLMVYASTPPGEPVRDVLNRGLSHAIIFFSSIKSLRDDIDRVHRIERAQVNLLFSRVLEDWGYNLIVRPQLEEFVRQQLQGDASKLGDKTERAEKFAFDALQKLATEMFDEQFRRNAHAILMNSGTRIQFRVSLLQQLQVRFPSQTIADPEIRQIIHTFFDGYLSYGPVP